MNRVRRLSICGVAIFTSCSLLGAAISPARADEAAAKAKLAAKGIRASHTGLSLADENELSKSVTKANSLKRKLTGAKKRSQASDVDPQEIEAQIGVLKQENEQWQQKINELNRFGFAFRGSAVSKLNEQISENNREIAELQQLLKPAANPQGDEHQKAANAAREAYVQQVLDAREIADRLIAEYAKLKEDPDVLAAVKEWDEATQKSLELKPSHSFENSLKQLEALEKKMSTGKVQLRKDGNDLVASVTVNDHTTLDMVVDAGSAALLLPHKVALDAGLKLDGIAKTTELPMADGTKVTVTQVVLKSVRVGAFTAQNVACNVLPAKGVSDKAVLGMSFLGQFKFQINAGTSELQFFRLDAETASTTSKKKSKHVSKKSTKTVDPQE
jgi:clan AA aspartic protease (TIGR02281 family)